MKTIRERVENAAKMYNGTVCPRCGEDTLREVQIENSLSRYCDAYICSACGSDEALAGYFGVSPENQLKHWWCIAIDYSDDDDCPSSTRGDYGPSNPWDAPGMSVSDFI